MSSKQKQHTLKNQSFNLLITSQVLFTHQATAATNTQCKPVCLSVCPSIYQSISIPIYMPIQPFLTIQKIGVFERQLSIESWSLPDDYPG